MCGSGLVMMFESEVLFGRGGGRHHLVCCIVVVCTDVVTARCLYFVCLPVWIAGWVYSSGVLTLYIMRYYSIVY